ncbi:MAG: ABC transporter permease [Chloroflexi bacterium]|nr:MAG: ABC transporter permease [Chloroflexota bacterium]
MTYLLRRLEFFVVTLWAALTLNFILPRLLPGGPEVALRTRFHGRVNPAAIKSLEVALGVNNNDSPFQQYLSYLGNLLHGDFGVSIGFFPKHVVDVIMLALPWTVGLVGMATVIAFVLGTLIGIVSAWRRGGVLDSVLPSIFVVTSAFPYFWIGLICIYVFSITLGWFPQAFGSSSEVSSEWSWTYISDVLVHSILPAFTIVLTSIGGWVLTMRNNMITTLAEDYVKMARAKGLSPARIMFHYAARNAILPNLVGFAMSLGFVISGALLVEIVFNYPGLGTFLRQAVNNEDFPLMQSLFLLITLAVLLAVTAADFLTAWLDPRTRERA